MPGLHLFAVRGRGLGFSSRSAVAELGLTTASRPSKLGTGSGVQVPIANRAVGSLPAHQHPRRRGYIVRGRGLEPPRPYGHQPLKLACLPVSAPAHSSAIVLTLKRLFNNPAGYSSGAHCSITIGVGLPSRPKRYPREKLRAVISKTTPQNKSASRRSRTHKKNIDMATHL